MIASPLLQRYDKTGANTGMPNTTTDGLPISATGGHLGGLRGGQKWADKYYKGGYEQYYKDKYGVSYKERDHSHRLDNSFDNFNRDMWNDYQMNQDSLLGSLKQTASQEYVTESVERAEGYADNANESMRGATMRTLDRADAGQDVAAQSDIQHRQSLDATTNKVDAMNNARTAATELRDAARDSIAMYRQGLQQTGGMGLQNLISARAARKGQKAMNQASGMGGIASGIGTIAGGYTNSQKTGD